MIENEKKELANTITRRLEKQGFRIVKKDLERPWGGFFVIDPTQAIDFAHTYFPGEDLISSTEDPSKTLDISGKILFVAPNKRLSWQYHERRNEIWRVVKGSVGVVTSETDEEHALQLLNEGDQIIMPAYTRHRLVGLEDWGIVSEIWQHTQTEYPSDEQDILRIQDDFQR